MSNKISVITVVFNDVSHIRETMDSFFSQTWQEKEYIVIDGGSTDGTVEIIKEYADRLAYWCSETDAGIYDAMNKGIEHATGDWINFLNSGDYFSDAHSLSELIAGGGGSADVIFGNSIEINANHQIAIEAADEIKLMEYTPIYRHGSSIVRLSVQRHFLFDTSRKNELGYALDWLSIYSMYKSGVTFHKVPVYVQTYRREGVSNDSLQTIRYQYKITSQGKFSLSKVLFAIKKIIAHFLCNSFIYKWATAFALEYTVNSILPHIPFWSIRKWYFRRIRMVIGKRSFIMKNNYIMTPNHLRIGDFTHINRGCLIDCRGGVSIGDNVSVSYNVSIISGSHDIDSKNFMGKYLPIKIEDNVWLGAGCTILQGITVGKGAVISAGSVVTKDVPEYTIVGGIPAKEIRKRRKDLDYHCIWNYPLT